VRDTIAPVLLMSLVGDHLEQANTNGSTNVSRNSATGHYGLKRPSNVTMSGVIFGGTTGAYIGGPIGAVLGIVIGGVAGEAIERYFSSDDARPKLG
jgi:hypothetical protein